MPNGDEAKAKTFKYISEFSVENFKNPFKASSVKISLKQLSVFNILQLLTIRTITTCIKITERETSKIYTRFILGNPLGGENPTKLFQYRFLNKYNVSL
jgi:hypothetical protein